ncbi:polysaccharide pyruvyl transferase family protein [uncultured Mailhella sp.]|uniref:polysaccharide pyruvyl transferase family protein n=1 Tax=uncultured Mailhella sp. TaxID=1981031 RepID=UPI0025E74E69|nr:polysaccharide pyruvyl transferase family protein [uncultured Mailhella sp.]
MDILYFSQIRLLPEGHGNIATVREYVARLRRLGHRVHYVLLNELGQSGEILFLSQTLVDTLDVIADEARPVRDEKGYYVFDTRYFDGLGEKVRELCLRYRVQAVICTYIFHSRILEFVPDGVLRIIDTHDRMTDRHLFLRSHAIRDEFFSCTRQDEARYLSRADVIWARRDEETRFFNEITHSKKCVTVSHFDAPRYLPKARPRTMRAGFLASDNEVNCAMVKDFVRAFAAKFEKEPLAVRFVIGGGVRALFERDGLSLPPGVPVELAGPVPKTEDFYRSLDLVVVPVTFGTGVNVKMVEAMSFGLPVLSTRCGIKGMASDSFWHGAETVDELVERFWKLWRDDAALASLAGLSRSLYQEFFERNVRAFDACFGRRRLPEPPREDCCGCGVCVPLCPSSALVLVSDEHGFARARRLASCVNCGRCTLVCPLGGPAPAGDAAGQDGRRNAAEKGGAMTQAGVFSAGTPADAPREEMRNAEAEEETFGALSLDGTKPGEERPASAPASAGEACGHAEARCEQAGHGRAEARNAEAEEGNAVGDSGASTALDAVFGRMAGAFACRSADERVRRRSSSAGVVRSLLVDALPRVDGVLALERAEGAVPQLRLFTRERDILERMAASQPAPVSYADAAAFLRDHEGRYLVVGLPCHLAALRRARPYLKGTFTAVELFCSGVRSLPFLRRCLDAQNKAESPFRPGASGPGAELFALAERERLFTQGACIDCLCAMAGEGDVQIGAMPEDVRASGGACAEGVAVARSAEGLPLLESLPDVERRSLSVAELYEALPEMVENRRCAEGCRHALPLRRTRAFCRDLNDEANARVAEVTDVSTLKGVLRPRLVGVTDDGPSCLIVPPDDGCGSFGDHAMLLSLLCGMKKRRPDVVPAVFLRERRGEDGFLAAHGMNVRHIGARDGRPLLERFAEAAAAFDHVVFMGADILDGGYGHACSLQQFGMMERAHALSLPVDVLGFSFRSTEDPVILDAVRSVSSFARLHVRDAVSFGRLAAAGCSGLVQVADLAFLFDENAVPPSPQVSAVLDEVRRLRAQGLHPVGLHAVALKADGYLGFFDRLARAFADVPGAVAVLLPHDSRVYEDKHSDRELLGRLAAYFSSRGLPLVNAVAACPDEAAVKRVAAALDVVVTSRMHLAIAAMSRNVPAVSFAYQGKFEGLYRFFEFDEPLALNAADFGAEDLAGLMKRLLRTDARPMMRRCNERLRELAARNFEFLGAVPSRSSSLPDAD